VTPETCRVTWPVNKCLHTVASSWTFIKTQALLTTEFHSCLSGLSSEWCCIFGCQASTDFSHPIRIPDQLFLEQVRSAESRIKQRTSPAGWQVSPCPFLLCNVRYVELTLQIYIFPTSDDYILVASRSTGQETWRLWATSFDASKSALRVLHNRWQECSQPITDFY